MPPSGKKSRFQDPAIRAKGANAHSAAGPGLTGPASSVSKLLRVFLPLAVMGITFIAFLPALRNGFVNWDDDKVLLQNEHFRGFGWPQLRWMATGYWIGHYHPLTWLSYAIDYRFWGLDERGAFGFHLTNIILHVLNAGLFYLLARRLLNLAMPPDSARSDAATRWAVALAALLFAVHPLRVESVAWVTERRDVLSVFFMLPCLLAYIAYATGQRRWWVWYGFSLGFLLLSLLSKAWGMTMPVVLLLLDWYPLRRMGSPTSGDGRVGVLRLLGEKLPFTALAAWAAYQAAQAQSSALYTVKTLAEYGWLPRVAQGFYGLTFYLRKTLLPTGLAPIYEIPPKMNPFEVRFIAAALLAIGITLVVLMWRRRWPAGPALWACYLVIVSPVLGLTQSGPQLVADRYSYIACLTWALLAGAGLLWLIRQSAAAPRRGLVLLPVSTVAVAIVAILAALTWRQAEVWRDSATLWRYTLAVMPRSYYAHTNLATELTRLGDAAAAEQHYQAALAIRPDGAEALTNYGGLLSNAGRYAEALPYLQRGLERNPNQDTAVMNLAITLQRLGRNEDAIALYRQQLAADAPAARQARLYTGLGGALGNLGRLPEAVECFRKAAALESLDDLPPYNLGLALRQTGDLDHALQELGNAARLARDILQADPSALPRTHLVDALTAIGEIHLTKGDRAAARAHFEEALRLDPAHAGARQGLRRIGGTPQ